MAVLPDLGDQDAADGPSQPRTRNRFNNRATAASCDLPMYADSVDLGAMEPEQLLQRSEISPPVAMARAASPARREIAVAAVGRAGSAASASSNAVRVALGLRRASFSTGAWYRELSN